MHSRADVDSTMRRPHRIQALLRAVGLLAALLFAPHALADRIVLLVDGSASMATTDAERLAPDALLRFVRGLPPETEVAVVAFDQRARLIAPLGRARGLSAANFENLAYDGAASDPSVAVERALYEFREQNARHPGRDVIVLLMDGGIDLGSSAANLRAEDWLLGDLRDELVAREIPVWGIALTDGADFRLLSRLTEATGGDYYRALTNVGTATALRRIAAAMGYQTPTARPVPQPEVKVAVTPAAAEEATTAPQSGDRADLRWWLAFAFLAIGVGLLGWVTISTLRERRDQVTAEEPALEYFPDCYLVDLHGVTDRPTHRLGSKYNMITRLQNPPEDGINYVQVFRRQIGRRHALIEYRDFSFWVIDQNSLNGSFLNGERLTTETRLKHGDRLRFHIYEFEFCVSDLALSNETLIEQERATSR